VTISPDGQTLASGSDDGTIKLWDVATGKERASLVARRHGVRSFLVFSPDGKLLASGPHDRTVKLWDVATGKERANLRGSGAGVWSVAFSPDGKALAVGSEQGPVKLWDIASTKVRATFSFPEQDVRSVAFSPDGKTVAGGGFAGLIRLWEVATGRERASLTGQGSAVQSMVFSPDGKVLASGHKNGVTRLWHLASGNERAALKGDNDKVFSLAITPDGQTLAIAEGPDTTIRLWDVCALTRAAPSPASGLSDRMLQALWTDLAGADASKAYRAIWALAAEPKQAVAWCQARLRPVVPADPRRVAQLLRDLDSRRFAERARAARELDVLGDSAGPALRKAAAGEPSPEVRQRVEQLLEKLEQPASSPERLRVLRAIEVLEHIGTTEARQVLVKLAGGMPEARPTREAKASLDRLAR
jgi:dipeptidyl aminopeptidase/acylaminoacyl peptidase